MAYTNTHIQTFPLRKVSSLGSKLRNQNVHALGLGRAGVARERVQD